MVNKIKGSDAKLNRNFASPLLKTKDERVGRAEQTTKTSWSDGHKNRFNEFFRKFLSKEKLKNQGQDIIMESVNCVINSLL